jgi:hypothetical protein
MCFVWLYYLPVVVEPKPKPVDPAGAPNVVGAGVALVGAASNER